MKWISVEDYLPSDNYAYVLVTCKGLTENDNCWVRESFFIRNRKNAEIVNPYYNEIIQGNLSIHFSIAQSSSVITHWMPLPNPPEVKYEN